MDFVSNKDEQRKTMLDQIGVQNFEELLTAIPSSLVCPAPTEDDGLGEMEGLLYMEKLAAKNSYQSYESYLGAGAYDHYVPAITSYLCGKSEFRTAYTPYQAEASQGMLQIIFEFQSMICSLTGMDVANGSLYDGASACAEGLLMAARLQKRSSVAVAAALHPHYRGVVDQYLNGQNISIKTIPYSAEGLLDEKWLESNIDEEVAAVLLCYPNFFGVVEDFRAIICSIQKKGALVVLCANPMAYGLFASAAELGADIAVGDCQPFGIPLQYGGPYAGYLACKELFVRQLPGRIIGETVDSEGNCCYVLTLQAREQHIRREKATSNICTNQALAAMASLIGMLWYGKEGLKRVALTVYQRSAYLKSKLAALPAVRMIGSSLTHFNEFVIEFPFPQERVSAHFAKWGIVPGVALERFFQEKKFCWLVAVTEKKTKEQLDRYVEAAAALMHEAADGK